MQNYSFSLAIPNPKKSKIEMKLASKTKNETEKIWQREMGFTSPQTVVGGHEFSWCFRSVCGLSKTV